MFARAMSARASSLLLWAAVALALFAPRRASAWVETIVRSYEARVEVARDGGAIVRHDLVLKIRGGPMKSIEIGGIGTIGEALPDAMVRSAVQGSAGAWPLAISSLEDGSLRLRIGAERGLRGGTYQFSFGYHVDLKELGRIETTLDGVELSFIGPRLTTGVDSARVTFVVPHAAHAPRLGRADETGAGVLLSEVRRGAELDEVELVRAHLAIGEPAIWRIVVNRDAISSTAFESPENLAPLVKAPRGVATRTTLLEGNAARRYLPLAVLLGLFLGVLAFLKGRFVREAGKLSDVRVKPLLPGPPLFRAVVVACAVSGAAILALLQRPWWAVAVLSLACAAATHLLPVRIVRPRGPGVWELIDGGVLPVRRLLPGRMFEVRHLFGFATFASLTLAILLAAYRILPQSNYFSLMVLSLEFVLVPLFFTGQLRDFPERPVEQARPWLKFLRRGVDSQIATLELWGRRASTRDSSLRESSLQDFDETRIRLILKEVPSGLRALEVSLDEAAGACVLPCVVIRALEDSMTVRALPSDVPWQRGRAPEERVAVLRPSAPTPAQLLRLLRTLLTNLRAASRHSSSRLDRSAGKGASTAKESLPSAQAM